MKQETKTICLNRLRRIEGQVHGVLKMVDDDRYCIDVITQVQAITAALKKVEGEILKDHVTHCVEHAVASGDKKAQREKIEELVEVMSRAR
jgi:DNA-binding FrmR family transcriptional regulator